MKKFSTAQMMKIAAATIVKLQDRVKEASEKLQHFEDVEELAFDLLNNGYITAEGLQEKIAELKEKPIEELDIIREGIKLNNTAGNTNGFKISEKLAVNEFLSAEEKFMSSLISN